MSPHETITHPTCPYCDADLKRLERERDEARALAAEWKEAAAENLKLYGCCYERDQLAAALADAKRVMAHAAANIEQFCSSRNHTATIQDLEASAQDLRKASL